MAEPTKKNGSGSFTAFLFNINQYLLPAAVVALTAFCFNAHAELQVLKHFMDEDNRFTSEQGIALTERVRKLEDGLPPPWLLEDIHEIKTTQHEILNKLSEHLEEHPYGYGRPNTAD